ncbi:MAG: amidohydrolase, partial [Bacteroidales bacterium]|nr:amidohydrolase [Bacteroidales bacterium]
EFPGKNILLIRIDGHASLVSKSLLRAAGIDKNTRIKGGEVIVDQNGEPTGMLIDNADLPAKALVPSLSREEKIKALFMAQQNCFEVGLSSVTDAGLSAETIDLIDELHTTGSLKLKLNVMLNPDTVSMDKYMDAGPLVKERLTVRSVKLYADGALGSRGAKLIEPYSDEPGQTGMILHERAYYEEICARAFNSGFAVNMHAIGDSANRFVLNLYASFLQDTNDLRWRIEHAQLVHPDDFQLFGRYSIIPSIQSTHATSDMYWAGARLGKERLKNAYAQQELLNQNGWLVNGTDFPIENISPLYTFYAAVSRKDLSGYPENGFQPENALSREDALRSITLWPAKGAFEESFKGSIDVGKQADFVVLEKDIMTANESELPDIKVRMLFIQGEKVFGD